jgi:hypothetical protein
MFKRFKEEAAMLEVESWHGVSEITSFLTTAPTHRNYLHYFSSDGDSPLSIYLPTPFKAPPIDKCCLSGSETTNMSSRVGLRFVTNTSRHTLYRSPFKTRQTVFRRQAATVAETPQQSVFQRLWTSEVGIKTVHFWYVRNQTQ